MKNVLPPQREPLESTRFFLVVLQEKNWSTGIRSNKIERHNWKITNTLRVLLLLKTELMFVFQP